jgi:cell division FtsZ-interacting protein ZapD
MTPDELRVFRRVLEIARGRLTKAGHVAIQSTTESRGLCNTRWRTNDHGPTCSAILATLAEAEHLAAEQEPVQIRMEGVA